MDYRSVVMMAPGAGERQIGRGLRVLALSGCTTRGSLTAGRGSDTLGIRDVWLWDGRGSMGRPHATVLIRNGRIVEVGANADVVVPERPAVACGSRSSSAGRYAA